MLAGSQSQVVCGGRSWLGDNLGMRHRCAGSCNRPDTSSGLCSRIGRSFWKLLVAWHPKGVSIAWPQVRGFSFVRNWPAAGEGQFLWEVEPGRVHTYLRCGLPHYIWDREGEEHLLVLGYRQCVETGLVSPSAPQCLCDSCGRPGHR